MRSRDRRGSRGDGDGVRTLPHRGRRARQRRDCSKKSPPASALACPAHAQAVAIICGLPPGGLAWPRGMPNNPGACHQNARKF